MTKETRIESQLAFLVEADRLKSITRGNLTRTGDRAENSAEHSWHLALWALTMAPHAGDEVDIDRAIQMLLLHDLVEIDAGDHPINTTVDPAIIAAKEKAAADRLFGILPLDQATEFRAIWDEFEAAQTPTALFAKYLDFAQPEIQVLTGHAAPQEHRDIARDNLLNGRASVLKTGFSDLYDHLWSLTEGSPNPIPPTAALRRRLDFLSEVEALNTVERATLTFDSKRRENSAEHSWHVALFVMVLSEYAIRPISVTKVIRMMLIHDIVEVDVGDVPIHSADGKAHGGKAVMAAEAEAASRLFGILPDEQTKEFRCLWDEFEAAKTDDALFAKAIDRVQPVIANLETGGGTWLEYEVTQEQLNSRVAGKVNAGAPEVWKALSRRIDAWFAENS